jgi:2-desacetyl-2-hydroxyethyl bacteriochlorophyllide A dehydrogenase
MAGLSVPSPEPRTWPTGVMAALAFERPGAVAWQQVPIPASRGGDLLVRVERVGICGTDVHLLEGTSPYVRDALTTYPIRPGHEWCGTVVATAADVDEVEPGQRVVGDPFLPCGRCQVCREGRHNLCPRRDELGVRGQTPGAAATYVRIPVANVARVPAGMPSAHAVLAEPAVTVLNALRRTRLQPGERVAVIGTGTLGLIAVQVAAAQGCHVDVIGVEPAGIELAGSFGAANGYLDEPAPADSYDVVVEASGAAAVTRELARVAAVGGRIAQVGITDAPTCAVDLPAVVAKGLTLVGILGGVSLLGRALHLIDQGVIRADGLIDDVVGSQDAVAAFERMQRPRTRPKLLIDFEAPVGAAGKAS